MKRLVSIAITTLIMSASAVGVSSTAHASPKFTSKNVNAAWQTKCVQYSPGPFKRIGSIRCVQIHSPKGKR